MLWVWVFLKGDENTNKVKFFLNMHATNLHVDDGISSITWKGKNLDPLLEENTGVLLGELQQGKFSWHVIIKNTCDKGKNREIMLPILKSFVLQMIPSTKQKTFHRKGEHIFKMYNQYGTFMKKLNRTFTTQLKNKPCNF